MVRIRVGDCGVLTDGFLNHSSHTFYTTKAGPGLHLGTVITCDEMKTVGKVAAEAPNDAGYLQLA
jgi:hypothetical protein